MKNPKKILMTTLFVIWAAALFAQFSCGFRAGATFPDMKVEFDEGGGDISFDQYIGYSFSFVTEFGLNEHFAIQPEFAWVQKGTKSGDKMRLNYLEVPVLAKFKYNIDQFQTYLVAGPTIGYAMTGFYKNGEKHKFKDSDWDGFNRLEIGSNFGLGMGFEVGGGILFLDGRYMLSLSNLSDEDGLTMSNKGFMVGIGFIRPPFLN